MPLQRVACLFFLTALCCLFADRAQAQIADLGEVQLLGAVLEDEDLSAAAMFNEQLMIASDEGSAVQILRAEDGNYRVRSTIQLYADPKLEADIEAISISANHAYAAGSHGLVRKKVMYPIDSDDRSYERNWERLTEVNHEEARNRIFRFSIAADGRRTTGIDAINLRPILAHDIVIAPFLEIASKEGGFDIEGLAVDGDQLYVGLRGPVLRENFVPVLKLDFDKPSDYDRLYVNLEGFGVRDLLKVSQGILILAGPVGDAPLPCDLYFWDGRDCVPGSDRSAAVLRKLGTVPNPRGGKAEAIALLKEASDRWELMVLYDGVKNGRPRKLAVTR